MCMLQRNARTPVIKIIAAREIKTSLNSFLLNALRSCDKYHV